MPKRLFIVGARGGTSVGESFERAAKQLGIETWLFDVRTAQSSSRILRTWSWQLRGRRFAHMTRFSDDLVANCQQHQPELLLATGTVPLSQSALQDIRSAGVRCINFLTDDPWNNTVCGDWFRDSLSSYDVLVTPRTANTQALAALPGPRVYRLPFGYDAECFYPEQIDSSPAELDVALVGGADRDRVNLVLPLLASGLRVGLFGAYWDRFAATKRFALGGLNTPQLRAVSNRAMVSLCIVRRKNRDGHVMRSLEAAACGECMLVERTDEHLELFGSDGDCVRYFETAEAIPTIARELVANDALRLQMRCRVAARMQAGGHRYDDRLAQILNYS